MFGPRRFHRHFGVWVAAFAVVGLLGWWLGGAPRPFPAECPSVGLPPGPRTEPLTLASPLHQRLLIAETVPGFGGMYWDPALHVYLEDMAGQEAATAAITAVLGEAAIPPGGIAFRQGRYGIARLAGWAACLGNTPVGDAGAVRADIDEAANGVRVLVESARAQGLVEREMQRLSIPAAAVRFQIGRVCGSEEHGLGDGDGAAARTACN